MPRTGYTYLETLSYSRNPKYTSESDWLVPIMSRRTTPRSSTTARSTTSSRQSDQKNVARLPEQEQHLLVLDDDKSSNGDDQYKSTSNRESVLKTSSTSRITSSSIRITSNPTIVNGTTPVDLSTMNGGSSSGVSSDLILTRSQCVPGKCSAGCPLHDNRRKRRAKNRDDASTNTDSVAGDFGTLRYFALCLLVECKTKVRVVTMHFPLSSIASLIMPINICTNYHFMFSRFLCFFLPIRSTWIRCPFL